MRLEKERSLNKAVVRLNIAVANDEKPSQS